MITAVLVTEKDDEPNVIVIGLNEDDVIKLREGRQYADITGKDIGLDGFDVVLMYGKTDDDAIAHLKLDMEDLPDPGVVCLSCHGEAADRCVHLNSSEDGPSTSGCGGCGLKCCGFCIATTYRTNSQYPIDLNDVGYGDPPGPVPCPQCGGQMTVDGPNKMGTLMFLDCHGSCGLNFEIPIANRVRLPRKKADV